MQQQKFITSHRHRVQKADEWVKRQPERLSVFDREALVEFYLLEDIARLYEYRLDQEKKKVVETRAGEKVKKVNIEKFTAILKLFKSAIEVAWGQITSGNYSVVWGAIPEHALMMASSNVKNLPELRKLAVRLLRRLTDEALVATEASVGLEEDLDDIDSHEANARSVKGLPSSEEIEAIIKAVEVAIPDKNTAAHTRANIN